MQLDCWETKNDNFCITQSRIIAHHSILKLVWAATTIEVGRCTFTSETAKIDRSLSRKIISQFKLFSMEENVSSDVQLLGEI